jgi:hypothetical protein
VAAKRSGRVVLPEKQRYFCKNCERNQVIGDNREKHSQMEKKQIKSEYGQLLIETGCVFLDLKSEMQALKS